MTPLLRLPVYRFSQLGGIRCARVDPAIDFRDLVRREAAEFRVLSNNRFVFGTVDTECLIGGDERFDPLYCWAQLSQCLVGFRCGRAVLFRLQGSDTGDFALNDVFLHYLPPREPSNRLYSFTSQLCRGSRECSCSGLRLSCSARASGSMTCSRLQKALLAVSI